MFLDEVGTMPLEVQAMMLRVLQEGVYYPVGNRKACKANVRIVSATNEDMDTAIREGRFREDLYHRLCGFEIRQPSLAECPEDILPLADFSLGNMLLNCTWMLQDSLPEQKRPCLCTHGTAISASCPIW